MLMQLWDMRNVMTPVKEFVGHSRVNVCILLFSPLVDKQKNFMEDKMMNAKKSETTMAHEVLTWGTKTK